MEKSSMFRDMNSDGLCSKQSATPALPGGFGVASLPHKNQESSWFGVLSVVFRPAVSFLKKYLPGRFQTAALLSGVLGSINEDNSLATVRENSFLLGIDEFVPAAKHRPHIAYLHYQHEASDFDVSSKECIRWISADALQELGIHDPADLDLNITHDTFPMHEIWESGKGYVSDFKEKVSATWFCGENDSNSQQVKSSTVISVAKPTELFVPCHGSVHNEGAGLFCHGKQADNDTSEKSLVDNHPVCAKLVNTRTVAACQSDVAVLTPDQDNGYSSLEEEHSNSRLQVMRPLCLNQGCAEFSQRTEVQGCCIEGEPNDEATDELPEQEREGDSVAESDEYVQEEVEMQALPFLSTPKCQNRAIAYIMGGPCSEDSDSELESDCEWDDDDGFDSEGSSEFSDSEDSDDEDDGEETDDEMEKLWNSLCQSRDPYNPHNFTAPLKTAPEQVAQAVSMKQVEGDHPISPDSFSSPSSSPKALKPEYDSGEEVRDVDEVESLRLWNSFNSLSDPYCLLNFQAPLRSQAAAQSFSSKPFTSPCIHKKETEERLDSGFSDGSNLDQHSAKLKKVRFVEDVEEFYASCDEDRRGPWEEFARDRCRFLRRVQETEDIIGYCLAPAYRLLIFQRLYPSC